MAISQNGWPVIEESDSPYLTKVPKIIGRVRKDAGVAELFTHLILWFDKNIEDLDVGKDEWGWNVRPIRGKETGYSNHASGTAIDLNAMKHPRGAVNTFSAEKQAKIRKQLKDVYKGTIRWGGDYDLSISKRDDMHFEIDASSDEIAAVLKSLGEPVKETPSKPEASKPSKPSKPSKTVAQMAKEVLAGKHGNGNEARQRSLGVNDSTYAKVRAEVNRLASGTPTRPKKSIAQMANEVIQGKHGNGHAARQKSLGIDSATYAQVRREVNRRY